MGKRGAFDNIKNTLIFIVLLIIFSSVFITSFSISKKVSPPRYPFQLNEIITPYPCKEAQVFDLNRDGIDEIIVYGTEDGFEHKIIVLTNARNVICQVTQYIKDFRRFKLLDPQNIDQDFEYELVYAFSNSNSSVIMAADLKNILNFAEFKKKKFPLEKIEGPDSDKNGIFDGSLFLGDVGDIDDDGRKEAIYYVTVGWDNYPRKVYVTNLSTGERKWVRTLGFIPIGVKTVDLNSDGKLEILIDAFSPCNGRYEEETDDMNVYAVVLDSDGNFYWKKKLYPMRGHFFFAPGDYNGDGKVELMGIITCRESIAPPFTETIFLFDPLTGDTLKSWHAPEGKTNSLHIFRVYDIDNDGKDELVVAGVDGFLRVFNDSLRIEREHNFRNCIHFLSIDDLNNDQRKEIILGIGKDSITESVLILNSEFKILSEFKNPSIGGIYTISAGIGNPKRIGIITGLEDNKVGLFRQFEMNKSSFHITFPFEILIILVAFLILTFLSLIYFRLNQKKSQKLELMTLSEQNTNRGVLIIDKIGNILYSNKKANSILGIPTGSEGKINFLDFLSGRPSLQKLKFDLAEFLRSQNDRKETEVDEENGRGKIIFELNKLQGKIVVKETEEDKSFPDIYKAWVYAVQDLIHKLKHSLNNINLSLAKIKEKSKIGEEKHFDVLEKEREKLKNLVFSLSKLTSLIKQVDLKPVDVNSIVKETLLKFRTRIGNDISIKMKLEEGLPPLYMDREKIGEVLDNLLENAKNAIKNSGSIEISTYLEERIEKDKEYSPIKKFVCIEVSDTGCGIPQNILERIFEPSFTTSKEGLGLGLTIVKYLVEAHGGNIKVLSEEGVGTTFLLSFPVDEK
jgi:signal transduction histidine kinase